MRNLDAHFSCQDASLVLQCFYGLHVCGQYIACYYTEHILSRCALYSTNLPFFNPNLCLVVDIYTLVLRLAPFTNFIFLSLLQSDFQLDRLVKVT